MDLVLVILSTIREPEPPPWFGERGSAPRFDRERKKLRRLDSVCEPGAERRDVTLSTRRPRPPGASTGDEVVGVEAAVEGGGGGSGS